MRFKKNEFDRLDWRSTFAWVPVELRGPDGLVIILWERFEYRNGPGFEFEVRLKGSDHVYYTTGSRALSD